MIDEPTPRASLLVTWGPAGAGAEFDRDYRTHHLPLVRSIPGLQEVRVFSLQRSPYHRLAELVFDSHDSLRRGMSSPEAMEAAKDSERLQKSYGMSVENHLGLQEDA